MKVTVSWLFWNARHSYYIRKRSWVLNELTQTPRRYDSKEMVPDQWFERGGVDPRVKSQRGDVITAKYAAKREQEINEAAARGPHRLDLKEIGELFVRRQRSLVDPKTVASYETMLSNLADFFAGEDPSRIHVGRLEEYRERRLQDEWTPRLGKKGVRKISPRTVWNELLFAVKLLGFGYDRRLETGMTDLPVRKPPDVAGRSRVRGRKLGIEEFWLAFEEAAKRPRSGRRCQRLLAFALCTWLRREPLLRLDRDWIDFNAATVTIPPQYVKKGPSRTRHELTLPLCQWAIEMLQPAREQGCVWGVNRATKRPVKDVQKTIARIARDAGLRPFSLHDLRRTGATILLNHRCDKHPGGVPKIVADRLLGHTMPLNDEAYFQIDLETMRDAVSVFDELWNEYRSRQGGRIVAGNFAK